jgi:hypothetical protein
MSVYGWGSKPENELEVACQVVETTLRQLRVTHVDLEYSEGVNVSNHRTTTTKSTLYSCLRKLLEGDKK